MSFHREHTIRYIHIEEGHALHSNTVETYIALEYSKVENGGGDKSLQPASVLLMVQHRMPCEN